MLITLTISEIAENIGLSIPQTMFVLIVFFYLPGFIGCMIGITDILTRKKDEKR